MSESSPRIVRVLRDLAFACLNATLILIAVSLFFGWRLADTVNGAAETLRDGLSNVRPLGDEVGALTTEIAALRTDLAAIQTQTGDLTSETAAALNARIQAFDARVDTVQARVEEIQSRVSTAVEDPEILIDKAVQTATDAVAQSVAGLAGCTLPGLSGTRAAPADGTPQGG